MNKYRYSISRKEFEFTSQLLQKLGIEFVHINPEDNVVATFEITGYSIRTHVLLEDIFDKLIETYRQKK